MGTTSLTIAVDAMGGDRAPDVVLPGVVAALADDPAIAVALVGPEEVVIPFANEHDRVTPMVASQTIAMDEHPAKAVRQKPDSSIVVGCRLVRDGAADAFFSAGSTGACMAAATLVIGRAPGVSRPAIAAVIPTPSRPVVLLDIGANADCKPEHLVQFGLMGAAYARAMLGATAPTVGLLNIGEEPTKGSALAQAAHAMLAEHVPGFVGNVEGRDVPKGSVDVVVTDGFTGNVTLKVMEGLSAVLFAEIKAAMTSSPLRTAAAAVLKGALGDMKRRLDPDAYGGAPLLGISRPCLIGHGSSGPEAIAAGIAASARAARSGLVDEIARDIAASGLA
ncbi:phosphate acyltransferase PlsX [Coriobacteriia bacterium Es71-Z0120]|uniref:phosphate acyltransferase PlsX n=1 Tax=Parvivirga hydrogeniphila TaxID=2939460 RepID=UPI002260FA4C|nr:phosphate acyltransferase PlsX [Parvivirga hydrogeniphila]MCL4079559.1 phosphate acyltransferase PlsX [Parvivirga hydrogeniphila]